MLHVCVCDKSQILGPTGKSGSHPLPAAPGVPLGMGGGAQEGFLVHSWVQATRGRASVPFLCLPQSFCLSLTHLLSLSPEEELCSTQVGQTSGKEGVDSGSHSGLPRGPAQARGCSVTVGSSEAMVPSLKKGTHRLGREGRCHHRLYIPHQEARGQEIKL